MISRIAMKSFSFLHFFRSWLNELEDLPKLSGPKQVGRGETKSGDELKISLTLSN
jgi:hypothetical protein